MTPPILLFGLGAIVVVSWLFRRRAKVASVTARFLVELLDALIFGYAGYVLLCVIAEFRAFETWEGAVRILFFVGWLSSWQKVAMLLGCGIAYMRFHQGPGMDYKDKREYRRGRHIMSFAEALATMNSILAWRAAKKSLKRPQHLDPDAYYEPPETLSVEATSRPIPDVETNGALQPYDAKSGEYDTILWAMLRMPEEEAKKHLLVVGGTGSGKTLLFHALMKTVLPHLCNRHNFRALIYDNKPDFLPFAQQFSEQLPLMDFVWNFDPFHASGVEWDIAADVTTLAMAKQVAETLSPVDPKEPQKYFDRAAQLLLEAAMVAFMEISGKEWTLRDVLLACSSMQRIKNLVALSTAFSAKAAIAAVFAPDKSSDEVMASIAVRLGPFNVVAALWSHAVKKRSVRAWSEEKAILLITGRSDFEEALRPINQTLFRLASLFLLSQSDSEERATWFFLDEVREIGKIDGLRSLANKGRSKGARLVLGFQTIEGMRAEHDENPGDEIANLCANKTFLHSNSEKTRKWMAESLGQIEVDETIFTHSTSAAISPDGRTTTTATSWNTQRQARPSMHESDFEENIKPASPEHGFTALNTIPLIGTYVSWVPWSWVGSNLPRPAELRDPLRPTEQQRLLDWDVKDLKRLRLPANFLDDERQRAKPDNPKDAELSDDEKHSRLWRTRHER